MRLQAGMLDRRIRIERKAPPTTTGGVVKPGREVWQLVAQVPAQVQDILPSRGENAASGITMSKRPARVRMRYRVGITSDMRFAVGAMRRGEDGEIAWQTDRLMQIVSGPAEIGGRRQWMEFVAETYVGAA